MKTLSMSPRYDICHIFMICMLSVMTLLIPSVVNASLNYTYKTEDVLLRIDTVSAPDGNKYLKFEGDNVWDSGYPGQPEMPFSVIRFLVPDNAYDFSVKINNIYDIAALESDLPVYPCQEAVAINDYTSDMFTMPDAEAYKNHSSSFHTEVCEDSWLEGKYHIVEVKVFPVAYSYSANTLEICGSIDMTLDYKEKSSVNKKKNSKAKNGFIDIEDIVVNAESHNQLIEKSQGHLANEDVEPNCYYIISEKSLLPALEDMAIWKKQKGYDVTLKALEDIYEDSRYKVNSFADIVDEAASLRKYLQDEYEKNGTFFCLLVGDHRTKMPIRKLKYTGNGITDKYGMNGDAYIPTDDYFSDLSPDSWSLYKTNHDIYVDNLLNVEFCPDIYVGRLLCYSPEQIMNYTSKLILYESNPGRGDSNYLDDSVLFVQFDGKGVYANVLAEMNDTFNYVDCFLDSYILNKTPGYPSGDMMLDKINSCGYSSLMGHGEPSTIACSGKFESASNWEYIKALNEYSYENGNTQIDNRNYLQICGINKMTNFDKPSVIYTLACTTTPFDVYDNGFPFDLPYTMSSSYTVGGLYGGVGYIGNTRSGYWLKSPKLEKLFLSNLKINPKIGVAEALSKYLYMGSSYSDYYVKHGNNLIGDPEFEIWRSAPKNLSADLIWESSSVRLTGSGLEDCRVSLMDGEDYKKVIDVKIPQSFLMQNPHNNDQMTAVGIFKTGYYPIVTLNCRNQQLKDCDKKFVVRDAHLGMEETSVNIGTDASVYIRTIDAAECGSSLSISDGGKLDISSDDSVNIDGSSVENGGGFYITGKRIAISGGFSVKKGGSLTINNNS
ncbi:MAG: C25 family cysteine peptidase [Muribaculum sp.]|nr:C25 family cysteine peptidase [Muribaculum sp.]